MTRSFHFHLPRLSVWVIILVVYALTTAGCGGNVSPTAAPTPSIGKSQARPTQGGTTATRGGASSPENAVISAMKAIEANDAGAYLDVVDPEFRTNIGNYFFFSQFMGAFTQLSGLGGELGKEASKVNFRDLNARAVGSQGALIRVQVSGFVRSPAFAIEQAFEDVVLVRQIGGRWFVSAPNASETALATQAAGENKEQMKKLAEQQRRLLEETILQKGELLVFCTSDELSYTLTTGDKWVDVPIFKKAGLSQGYQIERIRISPDRTKLAWVWFGSMGIMNIDGQNKRDIIPAIWNERWVSLVNWAPDSERLIAITSRPPAVSVTSISGQKVDTVWKGVASDASFTPDGKQIVISYPQKEAKQGILALYDPDSGEEKKIAALSSAPKNLAWSPDGKRIAFDTPEGVWVINADGTGLRQLASKRLVYGSTYFTSDASWELTAAEPVWSSDGTLLLIRYGDMALGLVQADGTSVPGYIPVTDHCSDTGVAWWIKGRTPAVEARTRLLEEGSKERIVNVGLTDQEYGLRFTIKEIQVLKDRIRVNLIMNNTGEFGRVFLQPSEVILYVLGSDDISQKPNTGHAPFRLKIISDIPSVLPVGKSWDGWLESDKPAPTDAVGAILVFRSFDFEKPYDQRGSTRFDWDSTQRDQKVWYQPLR